MILSEAAVWWGAPQLAESVRATGLSLGYAPRLLTGEESPFTEFRKVWTAGEEVCGDPGRSHSLLQRHPLRHEGTGGSVYQHHRTFPLCFFTLRFQTILNVQRKPATGPALRVITTAPPPRPSSTWCDHHCPPTQP